MITLLIILYILIGIIIGVGFFVFILDQERDCEPAGFFAGIMWPVTIIGYLIYKLLAFLIYNVYDIFTYIQDEGIHYCKDNLENCCGKCKYIQYHNNHNEMNHCVKQEGTRFTSTFSPCDYFKEYWLWRFKVRYKWLKE